MLAMACEARTSEMTASIFGIDQFPCLLPRWQVGSRLWNGTWPASSSARWVVRIPIRLWMWALQNQAFLAGTRSCARIPFFRWIETVLGTDWIALYNPCQCCCHTANALLPSILGDEIRAWKCTFHSSLDSAMSFISVCSAPLQWSQTPVDESIS